ncbi:MAG: hypothetical protein WAT39_26190 [Planctomycetota bacterium]
MTAPACRARRAPAGRLALIALAGASAGCSVADNLSCRELLDEVDRIVRIEARGPEPAIRYERHAEVSTWYVRAGILAPFWPLFGLCFGYTADTELENPAGHVRELLRELPDETGSDLLRCAQTAVRLGWIAHLDPSAQSRLVGVDGLATLGERLDLPLFADLTLAATPTPPDALATARTGFAIARPEARPADLVGPIHLQPYTVALATLTARPLPEAPARLQLLQELLIAYALEREDAIRPAVADAVRAAMVHVIEGALLHNVQGRAPEFVDLRLCAMDLIRRLAGPRGVPLLLAVMAASPTLLARGESRYDPDPIVHLRLIHYCGQLRGDLATTALRLPGRDGSEALSPADFLAVTILTEQAYYSKLRTPALVALTWCLQRPRLDLDPAWVREWRNHRGS